MTNSNNILDTAELLQKDFQVTFSSYWQRVEQRIQQGHITLSLILIVITGSLIARNFNYSTNILIEEVFLLILCLLIPFIFLILIYQFRKFRKRDFKKKVAYNRIELLLVITILLALCSAFILIITIIAFLLFFYIFIMDGLDGESLGIMAIYIPILLLSGFQTFYLGYSVLYLMEHYKLKKLYV